MPRKKSEKDNGASKRGNGKRLSHDHIRALDASVEESEEDLVEETDRLRRQNGGIL